MIRVRFAPSPTGELHIGAARTAFFNWLFAQKNKGSFILRIEDTDIQRSSSEMAQSILDGLQWLGIHWDEGPYYQSEGLESHRTIADELVLSGKAYYCVCDHEKNHNQHDPSFTQGSSRCACSRFSERKKNSLQTDGASKAIRFMVPEGDVRYQDLIHGPVTVNGETIEDFVLVRGDGKPTYHLSAVVDDIKQQITHVIRGDDHISNTPKQILLYRALQSPEPEFAHLALILGEDKKKLSKRHGVLSIQKFQDDGFLPLGLLNYLALMSWSVGEEKHVFSVDEMIQRFSLDRLSKGSPIFSLEKLEWLNGKTISQMPALDLFPQVRNELIQDSIWLDEYENEKKDWILKLIDLVKQRNKTLKDFAPRMSPFLTDSITYEPEGIKKYLPVELKDSMMLLLNDFEQLEKFDAESLEKCLRTRAEKEEIKAAALIHALRILVLGMSVSPGIFDVLEVMGKEKTLARIKLFDEVLKERNQ